MTSSHPFSQKLKQQKKMLSVEKRFDEGRRNLQKRRRHNNTRVPMRKRSLEAKGFTS